MLKRELFRGIVISNTCVKLYRNWIINEVARAGEHTNERTYVRTYSHTYVRDRPYIPSTTLLCEGIIKHVVVFLMFIAKHLILLELLTHLLMEVFSDCKKRQEQKISIINLI